VTAPHLLADGEAHAYISTACQHGQHRQCGVKQLARGDFGPPHCKYCPAVCACPRCDHLTQARDEARADRAHPAAVERPVIS